MYNIRTATPADAEALLEIYAPYITQTVVTYEYDIPDVEEFRNRIIRTLQRFPYLVAETDGKIIGYAYAGVLNSRAASFCSVETSIYISMDHRGKGAGRILYEALEAELRSRNITNMYACIAYNEVEDEYLTHASVHFHERMGFKLCGTLHHCAIKFNRSYGLVWMEKFI